MYMCACVCVCVCVQTMPGLGELTDELNACMCAYMFVYVCVCKGVGSFFFNSIQLSLYLQLFHNIKINITYNDNK